MRSSKQARSGDVAGTGELKAVAQQALRLGERAFDQGRAWLREAWLRETGAIDADHSDHGRNDMAQQYGRSGRESEPRRSPRDPDTRYSRPGRGQGQDGEDSWMHDKERQANDAGYSDYAYDPERDREYGHASAGDYGRDYARGSGGRFGADAYGPTYGQRQERDYGRGWREDGAPQGYRHGGERGMYGAYGPDVPARGYRGEEPRDGGWRAGGFDERSQSVGWEDDRGDAPGASPRYRASPRQGDPRHGYYVYGGDSAGHGGRERLHDYDEFDPRRGRHDEAYRDSGRRMGEGYGQSSGYAGGFGGSAYGAGFEPNREWSRERAYGAQSAYREGDGSARGAYREQGLPSHRGHGPRGYSRSDERIADELNERLTEDELIDARDIEVRCENGKVVLEGAVADRWMKHRAEDIADACGGVKDVDNRLRVQRREHAVLAAGPESSGRGDNAGRSAGSAAPSAAQPSGARTGGNAGAGSNPGTGAGTSSAGGSAQPH